MSKKTTNTLFIERLSLIRGSKSRSAFAKEVGVSEGAIRNYEGGTLPALDVSARIVKVGGVTMEWLIGDSDEQAAADAPVQVSDTALFDDDRVLPVLGTAAGSLVGSIAISGDAIDWVRRPVGLRGAKDAYGLYVTGDSMLPRFKTGELVFVHPHRPYRAGDDIIIQTKDSHTNETISFIKEYVRQDGNKYYALQYNPPAKIDFIKENVLHIHRVMRLNELVGV